MGQEMRYWVKQKMNPLTGFVKKIRTKYTSSCKKMVVGALAVVLEKNEM